jgi:sulfoxide reductase catalytic subunit YedY
MAQFINRCPWRIPESSITPESIFRQRRQLLKAAGFIGLSLAGIIPSGCGPAKDAAIIGAQEQPPARDLYPTRRDARFVLDRPLTEEVYAASYNNFYEFSVF